MDVLIVGVETTLDLSGGDQIYIEDCQVCCRPIKFVLQVHDGDWFWKCSAKTSEGRPCSESTSGKTGRRDAQGHARQRIEADLVGRDWPARRHGQFPLGLSVDSDEQAEYARELITAYNAAPPLPGDEPESFP